MYLLYMKPLICFIKKNKKHFFWGGISTAILYSIGVINEEQIIPSFLGTTILSFVGKEIVFNEKNETNNVNVNVNEIDENNNENVFFNKCFTK